jgi:hypothetical protein
MAHAKVRRPMAASGERGIRIRTRLAEITASLIFIQAFSVPKNHPFALSESVTPNPAANPDKRFPFLNNISTRKPLVV